MYYRANVSEIYPEGTAWVKVLDNVTSVSVNQNDQVISSVILYLNGCACRVVTGPR